MPPDQEERRLRRNRKRYFRNAKMRERFWEEQRGVFERRVIALADEALGEDAAALLEVDLATMFRSAINRAVTEIVYKTQRIFSGDIEGMKQRMRKGMAQHVEPALRKLTAARSAVTDARDVGGFIRFFRLGYKLGKGSHPYMLVGGWLLPGVGHAIGALIAAAEQYGKWDAEVQAAVTGLGDAVVAASQAVRNYWEFVVRTLSEWVVRPEKAPFPWRPVLISSGAAAVALIALFGLRSGWFTNGTPDEAPERSVPAQEPDIVVKDGTSNIAPRSTDPRSTDLEAMFRRLHHAAETAKTSQADAMREYRDLIRSASAAGNPDLDGLTMRARLDLAWLLFDNGWPDDARSTLDPARQACELAGERCECQWYVMSGWIEAGTERIDDAFVEFEHAREIAIRGRFSKELSWALRGVALVEYCKHDRGFMETLTAAVHAANDDNDQDGLIRASIAAAEWCHSLGDISYEDAVDLLSATLPTVRALGESSVEAAWERSSGRVALAGKALSLARTHFERSIEAAQRAGNIHREVEAMQGLADAYGASDDPDGGVELLSDAIRLAGAAELPQDVSSLLHSRAILKAKQGRTTDATSDTRAATEALPAGQYLWPRARIAGTEARIAAQEGQVDRAIERYLAAISLMSRAQAGDPTAIANAEWRLGTLYAGKGDWPSAVTSFDSAVVNFARCREEYTALRLDLADACGSAGEWTRSANEARTTLETLADQPGAAAAVPTLRALLTLGRALRNKHAPTAGDILQRCLRSEAFESEDALAGEVYLELALLEEGQNQLGTARQHAANALQRLDRAQSSNRMQEARNLLARLSVVDPDLGHNEPDPPANVKPFRFLRTEEFDCGGVRHEVRIYRFEPFARALALGDDATSRACEFVLVPAGNFRMGNANPSREDWRPEPEQPAHNRRVASFLIARTEAVQQVWATFTKANPASFRAEQQESALPVENVAWSQIAGEDGFFAKVGVPGMRLPSEAEWEYACRAGTTTPFNVGRRLTDKDANFNARDNPYGGAKVGRYVERTVPVASYPPNAFGLFDMHGNVMEWCGDNYLPDYRSAPRDGSARTDARSATYVIRGGSWYNWGTLCRSSYRADSDRMTANTRSRTVGFRAAISSTVVGE